MARKTPIDLGFDALRLEGGLFSAQHLARVAHEKADHQSEASYQIPAGLKLRDEIGRAFRIGQALWAGFARTRERPEVPAMQASTEFVTYLLKQAFGFDDLAQVPVQEANLRRFPIGHLARGNVPVVIAPHRLRLDEGDIRFADTRRRSAFQLAQEYLNASDDSLWAIVSNGLTLRLLRDNASLTRPAYLEADLERIFTEDRYADFSALWLILHASRFPQPGKAVTDCVLEHWRGAAKLEGSRVQNRLRDGVTEALLALGNGFLIAPANSTLRQSLEDGSLTPDAYFQQLLRLVYRLIFWFTVEDRGLLHAPDATPTATRSYALGYASQVLRNRALRRSANPRYADQWQSVLVVFRGLAQGEAQLGLPALGGLFAPGQCPALDAAALGNPALTQAVKSLAWFRDGESLTRINYRDMGPEELGSIYESLLELVPEVRLTQRSFSFVGLGDITRGNARKLTGSYYTPDSLVQELLKSALDPVLEATVAAHPQNPTQALLRLAVIDPACGSGHFLLAAARRLAERLASLRVLDGNPTPEDYRHALRDVIAHCIYGVDRNPMALELARTNLWLEAVTPDTTLAFLDHHLVCGDALLGLTDFSVLKQGIPKEAFKPQTGDDKEQCKALAAENRTALKSLAKISKQRGLEFIPETTRLALEQLETLSDDSLIAYETKRSTYAQIAASAVDSPLAQAADFFMAAFLAPKVIGSIVPTTAELVHTLYGTGADAGKLAEARRVTQAALVLHWPLAFAQVLGRGGFDVVLGNPPWERMKLQEEEFFSSRAPEVANARNTAERQRAIDALAAAPDNSAERRIHQAFVAAKQAAEASSVFCHTRARYPLTGVGDVNTYALFAETSSRLVATTGRAGLVLPLGIAIDDSTKRFFGDLVSRARLSSLIGLTEIRRWFPGTDDRNPFCLLTNGASDQVSLAFYIDTEDELRDSERRFVLGQSDFASLNPNTRTCAIFRSREDADITKKIYQSVPVLWREELKDENEVVIQIEHNPWGLRFARLFDMSTDSGLFHSQPAADRLPLYEAKLIHQFDHRWATYDASQRAGDEPESRDLTLAEKQDPSSFVRPRYWVETREALFRLSRLPPAVLEVVRSGSTDLQRLMLASHLFSQHLRQQGLAATEAVLPQLYHQWCMFTQAQPFAASLAPTRLGLCGDNPALMQRTAASQLPATPASELVDAEHEHTAWYEAESQSVGTWLQYTGEAQQWFGAAPPLRDDAQVADYLDEMLEESCPRWLMGWRDICRATDERTVIASVLPRIGVGHTLPCIFSNQSCSAQAALLGNLNSLTLDYIARLKVGGTHLTYGYLKQFFVLPPEVYSQSDIAFIVPRVLGLTYTANDLQPFYADVVTENPNFDPRIGPDRGQPFAFSPERRAQLRAELDARYAKLYGLSRRDLQYILDPTSVMGQDYPSETFRVLKNKELRGFGEYRTQRLVLAAWDEQESAQPVRRRLPLPAYAQGQMPLSEAEDWLVGVIYDLLVLEGPVSEARIEQVLRSTPPGNEPWAAERATWLSQTQLNRLGEVFRGLRIQWNLPARGSMSASADAAVIAQVLGDERTSAVAQQLLAAAQSQDAALANMESALRSGSATQDTTMPIKRA